MECSEPGAIRDEEFIAYLAGERVRPVVEQHLARCQRCSSQLAMYRRIEQKLIHKLYRWDCPSNEELGEYEMGLLATEQALRVQYHLAQCMLCAAEIASLAKFLASDPIPVGFAPTPHMNHHVVPPSFNHRLVQNTKRAVGQLQDHAAESVRRIIATLVVPPQISFARGVVPPPISDAHGLEQEQIGWPRQYVAENISVSLRVEREPGHKELFQLNGLVTRQGTKQGVLQGTPVQLAAVSNAVHTQQVDDLGNFVFPSLPPSTYMLELQFPEGVIVIGQFTIDLQDV
ncbi:MAG: hypothetical protein E6J34_06805 [Chloroflexi bacterium]|jgi:hypothetical protein|nr:MAG: hypothetical protein E6J34_06805 [Chloroflexota bacterium]